MAEQADRVVELVSEQGTGLAEKADRVDELELELAQLMEDVERYRSAAEDALQQLDWCIGYFAGIGKGKLSHVLGANRATIRRKYLKRAKLATPTAEGAG